MLMRGAHPPYRLGPFDFSVAGTARSRRGMTLVELMVVVAIIAILSTGLISGYARFSGNNKVASTVTRLTAALHLARNLAIANNRVYHVWFDNNDNLAQITTPAETDPQTGVVTPAHSEANPNFHKPLETQTIYISYFKSISRAMEVTERQPEHTTVKWNLSNSHDASMDNFPVTTDRLPERTYIGVQYAENVAKATDLVLYFKPDGTASQPMTFFVTDNPALADNLLLDARAYQRLQTDRINALTQRRDLSQTDARKMEGSVKMVQVYGGGMIREIKKTDTNTGTVVP